MSHETHPKPPMRAPVAQRSQDPPELQVPNVCAEDPMTKLDEARALLGDCRACKPLRSGRIQALEQRYGVDFATACALREAALRDDTIVCPTCTALLAIVEDLEQRLAEATEWRDTMTLPVGYPLSPMIQANREAVDAGAPLVAYTQDGKAVGWFKLPPLPAPPAPEGEA